MTEFSKNNIYYSIFCPQCDYINSDLLSEIRYNFFVYNKRQKKQNNKRNWWRNISLFVRFGKG